MAPIGEGGMARIIEFPKIHRRFYAMPKPGPGAGPARWLLWCVALVAGALAAPLFLLLSLLIGLWPVLWWILVANVIVLLIRIVFIGGMSAVLGGLHLSVLAGVAILVALLVNALADKERGWL